MRRGLVKYINERAILGYWKDKSIMPPKPPIYDFDSFFDYKRLPEINKYYLQEHDMMDDEFDCGGLPEINNHYFKYTDRVCEECGGQVVYDPHRNEYYCLKCGLVQE